MFYFSSRPNRVKIAAFAVLIVTLFLGVLVFSYFRYITIFRTLHFGDSRVSHHRRISTTAANELKKEE